MSYLKTIAIQHLNGSSPSIYLDTNRNVGIANSSPGAKVHIAGANTVGGTGYADFLRVTNESGGTNINKTFRLNQTGSVEIINNAYSSVIMSLDDSGNFAVGSRGISKASMPAGSILQVVQTVISAVSSYSGSTYQDITGMSVAITPTSSTSKILVIVDLKIGSSGNQFQNTILRNGTQIYVGDASGSHGQGSSGAYYADGNIMVPCPSTYLDSPATTSTLTYKLQGRTDAGAAWYLNRTPNDANSITGVRTASSITVMEVAV